MRRFRSALLLYPFLCDTQGHVSLPSSPVNIQVQPREAYAGRHPGGGSPCVSQGLPLSEFDAGEGEERPRCHVTRRVGSLLPNGRTSA